METNKQKIKKQIIIKMLIVIAIHLSIVFHFIPVLFLGLFFAERFPNERMQMVMDFLSNNEYIGMSRDECLEMFGEEVHNPNIKSGRYPGYDIDSMMVFKAGRCQWGLSEDYLIYLFFDENGYVEDARISSYL